LTLSEDGKLVTEHVGVTPLIFVYLVGEINWIHWSKNARNGQLQNKILKAVCE